MRFIIEVACSVPYEASWTDTHGIEYISRDDFLLDFEINVMAKSSRYFIMCGIEFDIQEHRYEYDGETKTIMPDIYTVDEWFAKELK